MAWRRSGDKPLSEPMMVSLLTHICVTRPQWVNPHILHQCNTTIWAVEKQYFTLTSQWARWRLKSPASGLFTQLFIQMQIKENIKAPHHWPLRGEFTKCFHLMTSSWNVKFRSICCSLLTVSYSWIFKNIIWWQHLICVPVCQITANVSKGGLCSCLW